MLRALVLTFAGMTAAAGLYAQAQLPLEYEVQHDYLRYLEKRTSGFHTAVKPWNGVQAAAHATIDSVYRFKRYEGYFDKLANGHPAGVEREKFRLSVDPVFDLNYAGDLHQGDQVFEAGFGGRFQMEVAGKMALGFTFREYRGDPVEYARGRLLHRQEVPGYGQAGNLGGKYLHAREYDGYLHLRPNKYIAFEGGYGKHFWGDGYRSFFLSDNASSYPYFKFELDFWRVKYAYLFTVLKYGSYDLASNTFDLSDPQTKYGVFHYISVDAAKWLQFGFFEGVVWKRADSTGVRGVEWNYLNPVVFIRPVEFALGSPDNVILGVNFKFKMGDRNQLYTQLALDDLDIGSAREGSGFYRTKVAWQIGYRSFDLFRVEHLDVQTEFNLARPYVYAHKTPEQNYAHYNQSLAHPLDANFWEWLIFVRYRKDRWYASFDFQWAKQGGDDPANPDNNHNGSNIFVSDFEIVDNIPESLDFAYGNEFLQGVRRDIASVRVGGGFILNPTLNMRLGAYAQHRVVHVPEMGLTHRNTLIGVRFATALFNRYYDF